jgi:serine/threonine protein phosphatase PrpC
MKISSYAAQTHQGPYLQLNEDGHDIDIINNLFMVLDGYGGSGVGEKVVAEIKENVKNFFVKISGDSDSTLPFYFSHKFLIEGNSLLNAIHYAHKKIFLSNEEKDWFKKGGASGVFACSAENIMTLIACGNCQSYLYRKGKLISLIKPDSKFTFTEDPALRVLQNTPYSGFGMFEDIHLQTFEVRIQKGDLILLQTDGVYSRLQEQEVAHILGENESDLNDKITQLFTLANERGNRDNQTSILLKF